MTTYHLRGTDGTEVFTGTIEPPPGSGSQLVLGIYGDGSDGNVTVGAPPAGESIWNADTPYTLGEIIAPLTAPNGHRYVCTLAGTSQGPVYDNEPAWTTQAGSVVTDGSVEWTEDGSVLMVANRLQRDLFAVDLTIEDGRDLETSNFRVFVRGTLTLGISSDLCSNGNFVGWNGSIGMLGGAPHGGEAKTTASDGESGDDSFVLLPSVSGSGGDTPDHAGGVPVSDANTDYVTAKIVPPRSLTSVLFDSGMGQENGAGFSSTHWGGQPGGSGANNTGLGTVSGAGGGGGGIVVVVARHIVNSGVIAAVGGDGGDATGAGIAGGGGAGAGGLIVLVYESYDDSGGGTFDVSGGTGGAGVGVGGLAGGDAGDGLVVQISNAAA